MQCSDESVEFVYNIIAPKFDKTRYKVWSTVQNILDTFTVGSNNIDMGCGNGKNMIYRKDIDFYGIDISQSFIDICKSKGLNCHRSDVRNTSFNDNMFDNCISIAVIHHLDSQEKRIQAIKEMFRITKSGGTIFIYVWAKDQTNNRFNFNSNDMMIPFEYEGIKHYRYYHLYEKNELEYEVSITGYNYHVKSSGYEQGNYYIELIKN